MRLQAGSGPAGVQQVARPAGGAAHVARAARVCRRPRAPARTAAVLARHSPLAAAAPSGADARTVVSALCEIQVNLVGKCPPA